MSYMFSSDTQTNLTTTRRSFLIYILGNLLNRVYYNLHKLKLTVTQTVPGLDLSSHIVQKQIN